jgi:hypothetical protein
MIENHKFSGQWYLVTHGCITHADQPIHECPACQQATDDAIACNEVTYEVCGHHSLADPEATCIRPNGHIDAHHYPPVQQSPRREGLRRIGEISDRARVPESPLQADHFVEVKLRSGGRYNVGPMTGPDAFSWANDRRVEVGVADAVASKMWTPSAFMERNRA